MNSAQLINQDSGNFDYYTPIEIVDAAREVMGGIDLDPASSAEANKRIKADVYYHLQRNGLTSAWFGKVWLNHPFSREGNPQWVSKLLFEYARRNISQACCITFAATSEKWFQPLLLFRQCFLHPRTNYYMPDGTKKRGVTKGSVVTYLGEDDSRFSAVFSKFGVVK